MCWLLFTVFSFVRIQMTPVAMDTIQFNNQHILKQLTKTFWYIQVTLIQSRLRLCGISLHYRFQAATVELNMCIHLPVLNS